MASDLLAELTAHFNARHLYPTRSWLQAFLSSTRPNTPLPALKQTALFRLLATDLTVSFEQPLHTVFPQDILTSASQSRYLAGPVLCQLLDVEDIGRSRWSQVEAIESQERGEKTKGREIVRVVLGEEEQQQLAEKSKGPFKLLLQDANGLRVYALDLSGKCGLDTNSPMGVKIVLRDSDVRRGVVMLEPGRVQVLGGKIEPLDKEWKRSRKDRLMRTAAPNADNANRT
ncbi:uncharacterized protein EI97DRAFT_436905 [Westerdykella ornata]|uniref:RecQ-mediated genome instability protein 1 n=1 Tax=Westerdykella ornata TaxID=318751 RepID=A0A6A6J8S4_WESOR|nr:uncharacterized protein EI97DRAFT_436905 [Westerdykella ornata]KAF2272408.1 hypothetical protein EI97DRAFT_436905 [Westerdykella ornata]